MSMDTHHLMQELDTVDTGYRAATVIVPFLYDAFPGRVALRVMAGALDVWVDDLRLTFDEVHHMVTVFQGDADEAAAHLSDPAAVDLVADFIERAEGAA